MVTDDNDDGLMNDDDSDDSCFVCHQLKVSLSDGWTLYDDNDVSLSHADCNCVADSDVNLVFEVMSSPVVFSSSQVQVIASSSTSRV